VKTTVTMKSAERKAVTLDVATGAPPPAVAEAAPPPPAPAEDDADAGRRNLRVVAFVAAGVGVAGLATFAIEGSAANSTYHDLQNSCHGPCPPSKADDISSGKKQQTIANIGLAVGIVGAAAATTLFVLSMPKHSSESATVSFAVGPTWMGMRGAF
jgi:hypothetical protein